MASGYYRFPTIHGNTIVFCSEDDLWTAPVSADSQARRLTSSLSEVSRPLLSPDGMLVAFTAREEGNFELYVMPATGGQARRLTFFGGNTYPVGWDKQNGHILFASNTAQPFPRITEIYSISPDGGPVRHLPVGPASSFAQGPNGGVVIGRNTGDPARWKRYRGGTAGVLWIDTEDNGQFRRLLRLNGNMASPMWVGSRIYFVDDHEGYGNIYSCTPAGEDLQRHTNHTEYYARNASTDGRRIVYHAGGDLRLFDPADGSDTVVDTVFNSPRTQRNRKFINSADYLQGYAPHPEGHSVALTLRGKPFTMGLFSGPAIQHGSPQGVRYRLTRYLNDGLRLVAVSDDGGEEVLALLGDDKPPVYLHGLDIGRPINLEVSPKDNIVAFANHRNQILVVNLDTSEMKVLDQSATLHDSGIAWSPDGRWLAFSHADNNETSYLMIADVHTGQVHQVTTPILHDIAPSFDPDGNFLYFLSFREFNPVYDNLRFDLGFPRGTRPYLLTLRKDITNPFIAAPRAPKQPSQKDRGGRKKKKGKDAEVHIDFDGITRRILPVPLREGRYEQVVGAHGRVYAVSFPVEGSLDATFYDETPANGVLESYDLDQQKAEVVVTGLNEIRLSGDGNTMLYRSGKRLRALAVAQKPDNTTEKPGRDSGWLDLSRPSLSVVPADEWKQMYREAWRLQREFFWTQGMLGIDWDRVYTRYLLLLDRVATRSEFSDVIWEMHGELGTSHAYEMGGDYRKAPMYSQGFLGADFDYDDQHDSWVVSRIVRGDSWSSRSGSPLEQPGINVLEGDRLLAVNSRALSRTQSPQELLVNTAGTELSLTFASNDEVEATRTVVVRALTSENPARYREWVESNRVRVHEMTAGRVGYVHVPNMGPLGYSEFFRGFLDEVGRGSLIVDVRFNGGGHVSQLILEQLARETIGYRIARYSMVEPYPMYSVRGPIVALTNEYAGSDGDIFSHAFKLMRLGPLVGKRTWGGVVGIWPRNALADGSMTTQPEFSTWFSDTRWGVENYGTDPDIEVEILPQDYVAGHDPQLERAVQEALKLHKSMPGDLPEFGKRPVMAPGPLPNTPPAKK